MGFDGTLYDRSDILHSLDTETKQFEPSGAVHIYKVINNHDLVRWPVKAILFQAWTGPEGSRRLRLPDLKTIDT
jgi:hypothetical protein